MHYHSALEGKPMFFALAVLGIIVVVLFLL
jgi:hypothetical protein